MRKLIYIIIVLLTFTNLVKAQKFEQRRLSYSQLFDEMATCEREVYRLTNATIEYNHATDQRFLEADSLQLARFDTIRINCQVYLDDVFFKNTPDDVNIESGNYLPEISFQKILFTDSVTLMGGKIEIKSITHCSFFSTVTFTKCEFSNYITFDHCIFREGLTLWGSKFHNSFTIDHCIFREGLTLLSSKFHNFFTIQNSKLSEHTEFKMLELESTLLNINNCILDQFSMNLSNAKRLIFRENTTKSHIAFTSNTIGQLEIYRNHYSNLALDSIQTLNPLIHIIYCTFEKFYLNSNKYEILIQYQSSLHLIDNTITSIFSIYNTDFPTNITLRRNNINGSFRFGRDCSFEQGISLYENYFNERSAIDWRKLKGKLILSDFAGLRQFPASIDSIQSYGLLERELGNTEYCEALIKSKRMFYNVFKTQGLSSNANEVLTEIKDLETAIWKHKYQGNKTLKTYFHWKMNVFLKKFSAYGTNPVIAIIYSLKVILLFALFYLFFHNDWDIGSRKRIGKRLHFLLKYFQVNKGLVELDEESQSEVKREVKLLHAENEKSTGKVPGFFSRVVRWYIKSNLISASLRKKALQRMDILSGTYSELPDTKKRSVAFISGIWFVGFLLYTLLLKILNALTLSLNAFTTLGFGNIPTKGFSRYVVILQGFIGWVLMTIFSVTLISQLIQ